MSDSKVSTKRKKPAVKTTPKSRKAQNKIKRKTDVSLLRYIPQEIDNIGISREFLTNALGAYYNFRKEPEVLMTRRLENRWNYVPFRGGLISVGMVTHHHSWESETYSVMYDAIEIWGDLAAEWYPRFKVRIVEYCTDYGAQCELGIFDDSEKYIYQFAEDKWTVEASNDLKWLIPKDSLPAGTPLPRVEPSRGIEFGSKIGYMLQLFG